MMTPDQERECIRQARTDPRAFAPIDDHYFPRVYAYVSYRVYDRQDAEDVIAEVSSRAIRNLERFRWRSTQSFAAWLFRIAHNLVLDDVQPGIPLRMAFDWRVEDPVSDSLVMFVHLMRDDVELVAQRDAVPGDGLFPVDEWSPGEPVRDQFALLLPPTLPAGEYEIQVGIYDATTLLRRSLVEPESGTVIVVQQLDVR